MKGGDGGLGEERRREDRTLTNGGELAGEHKIFRFIDS